MNASQLMRMQHLLLGIDQCKLPELLLGVPGMLQSCIASTNEESMLKITWSHDEALLLQA